MPDSFVNLLIVDPPYNLTKKYNNSLFNKTSEEEYENWLREWIKQIPRIMTENGSLYFCGDWQSSPLMLNILKEYFVIQNRITWEREKGRGAKNNWKNNIEDIYFCTMQTNYVFNVSDVMMRKKVIAPYKDENNSAKDWFIEKGVKYRFTCPSNVWTDITIPYWSMSENTEHPTQKSEKLIAKLILASSNENDIVLDPFMGSGTTCIVAKKLNRRYIGIEIDLDYCCIAEKRLETADNNKNIQGYSGKYFSFRNE